MSIDVLHQLIPTFVPGDAVGAHTRQARDVLRGLGLRSDIYADSVAGEYAAMAKPFHSFRPRGHRQRVLYQASTGCRVGEFLLERGEPILLNYHNVSPAGPIGRWDQRLADEVAGGRKQVAKLAALTTHAIAVSRYNEEELLSFGYRSTSVAPFMVDYATFDNDVDKPTLEWMQRARDRGGANILFVGRVVPHKAQHDLIKALVAFRRLYDPRARLYLVGGSASEAYTNALKAFAGAVGLRDAVDFAGWVSDAERAAYYRGADVFLCLSDHEGFCVPLMEAMYNDVPVIAYASAAIPETLAGAGLLLPSKQPDMVAAALDRVTSDAGVRQTLVAAGRRRLGDFAPERTRAAFGRAVTAALAAGAAD